jgi:hypothetical protein
MRQIGRKPILMDSVGGGGRGHGDRLKYQCITVGGGEGGGVAESREENNMMKKEGLIYGRKEKRKRLKNNVERCLLSMSRKRGVKRRNRRQR